MNRIESMTETALGWMLSMVSWGIVMRFPAGSVVEIDRTTEKTGRDIETGEGRTMAKIEVDPSERVVLTVPTGGFINVNASVNQRPYKFNVVDWRAGGDAYINGFGGPDIHILSEDETISTHVDGVTARLAHHQGFKRTR